MLTTIAFLEQKTEAERFLNSDLAPEGSRDRARFRGKISDRTLPMGRVLGLNSCRINRISTLFVDCAYY